MAKKLDEKFLNALNALGWPGRDWRLLEGEGEPDDADDDGSNGDGPDQVQACTYLVNAAGQVRKLYMAEMILAGLGFPRPTATAQFIHRSGNTMDNTPENLAWVRGLDV